MSNCLQKSAFFLIGCVGTAAVVVLLGASSHQADSPRYDADFDTIMGGLGGFTIEVTDHDQQKAYLYVVAPGRREKQKMPAPQLAATIDLKSAGEPTLAAQFAALEAKKETDE
jgi:hypothetical protein